jgi:ribosome-binding protein aMBF1 (putative translation factor)
MSTTTTRKAIAAKANARKAPAKATSARKAAPAKAKSATVQQVRANVRKAATTGNGKATPKLTARHVAAGNSDTAHYVAQQVRAAREKAGLTTAQLAERMATSDGAVRRIEDARTNCTAATLANVAQGLGAQLVINFGKR